MAALAGLALLAGTAHAQSVEAEALFQEGRRLLKEGKVAEACDKLEASQRLEPSVGTLLNLADCREKNGQLATAWAEFLKAEASARRAGKPDKRADEAKRRAKALEPRLSYLTISVPENSKIEGLTVTRNGTPIDPALWNTGVPVDAGTYEISASAPGHEAWSTKVTIAGEAIKQSVEVPRFKKLEELTPDKVTPPPATPPPDEPLELDDGVDADAPGTFTPMRYGAIASGVVGLAAVGFGVARGLSAKDKQAQADELCPEAACGDPAAIALNDDAQSHALQANLGFAVGGLAIAGAVALWILGEPDAPYDDEALSVRPTLGRDGLGLTFGGRF